MRANTIKRIAVFLAVFTVIIGLCNWYLRKVIRDSYVVQLSYNQLYIDSSLPRLKNAVTQNGNLRMELAGDLVKMSTNIHKHNTIDRHTFVFTPKDAGKLYWLKPHQSDSIYFSIDYTSDEAYKLAFYSGKSYYEIRSNTLHYADSKLSGYNTWAYNFESVNDPEDLALVTKYIRDSIGIRETESSLKKIEKLFAHIMPLVKPNGGIPADSVTYMPVLKLLNCLKKNEVKIWCGTLTQILGFFASQIGLPSRVVTTEGYDKFSLAVHSFNEIYIPEEKKWIYSDLTTGIAYVLVNNNPINIVDLNRLLRVGILHSNAKAIYYGDSLSEVGFESLPSAVNTYFNAPQRFRYYFPKYLRYRDQDSYRSRIKKFLDPHLTYAFYDEDNHYSSDSFIWRKISTHLLLYIILMDFIFLLTIIVIKIKKHLVKDNKSNTILNRN